MNILITLAVALNLVLLVACNDQNELDLNAPTTSIQVIPYDEFEDWARTVIGNAKVSANCKTMMEHSYERFFDKCDTDQLVAQHVNIINIRKDLSRRFPEITDMDIDEFSKYFNDVSLLHSALNGYEQMISDSRYIIERMAAYDILQTLGNPDYQKE